MADDTDSGAAALEESRNSAHAHGELPDCSTDTDAADAFRSLQPGETISVHRVSPSYAQGYLDHIVVPHGDELDVMSELKSNWGGGRYQLKAKRRASNGKMVFSGINATLTVAGDPTLNGQVYRNGRLVDPERHQPPHAAPQVVYAQQPAPTTNPMDPINARILGMVESALQNGGGNAGGSGTDIVGLIGALRDTLQPAKVAPAEDPFKNMERTLAMLSSVRETFAGEGRSEDSGGGMTGLGSGIESILMQKILGGGAPPQQQQPPPWQQPTQQWMQGQWGGPPQGPPGSPPINNPPPPSNWPNAQGQVPWQQPWGPPPPPGWAQTPPGQPPAAPKPTSPPQQAEDHDNDDRDSDDGEEELYTVDNLMGELEGMEPDDRNKFVEELAQRFGIDKLIGEKMFPHGVPTTQSAAGQAIPDFSGVGPMPGTNPTP